MGRRGAKVIYICNFRNTLLNIGTSFDDFFVAECIFVRSKASGCAHVAWSQHTLKQQKNKVTRNEAPTVKLIQ